MCVKRKRKFIKMDEKPPYSAPTTSSNADEINRKALYRRSTGNCKQKRKSIKMPSSSSSLISILKPSNTSDEGGGDTIPNLSFDDEYSEIKDVSNQNEPSPIESVVVIDGRGGEGVENLTSQQSSSSVGFRLSFFTVLEKLGVFRTEDLYKTQSSDSRFPATTTTERRIGRNSRNSISSLYYRAIYGGKFFILFFII